MQRQCAAIRTMVWAWAVGMGKSVGENKVKGSALAFV